ncbi:MAG: type II and III secretion system protein family protein [Proteobacteria bacterium]|nr:type II and III secretion system protein family protein [Pseudomonadota bacterium]
MFSNSKISLESVLLKAGILAASLLTAASLAFGIQMGMSSKAAATDLDAQAASDGHFVRIGQNKSVVVRLPAEARDVIVGNSDIVDIVVRSKNTAYLFARKMGQTNAFFFDANGQQILSLDIEVALDVTAVRKALLRALPGTKITVDTINGNIALGGVAQSPIEAKTAVDLADKFLKGASGLESGTSVLNMIKVAGDDQVMLKVRVVEMQRDVLKQLGVDLQALINAGSFAFNLSSINPFNSELLSPDGGYAAAFSSGGNSVDTVIRAMEGDGLLRTLAEPNLTALSGQGAKFRAGGEFPYQTCDRTATTRDCTTEFKEFGISLDFTPTVLDDGRINLNIATEVSELASITSGDTSIPSLNKRGASTVLELPSGGSMMIAGLIRETTRQNINGTPGLKKLPVLGALFRSREFISNETELVIMVTPYLVRATNEKKLISPDKGFNPPTDRQAIFFGRLNKVYGKGQAPDGQYNGNVGFIVE